MRQINFVPPEVAERESRHRLIPFLVLAGLLGIAAVLLPWFILKGISSDLDKQVALQQVTYGLVPSPQDQAQNSQLQRQITDTVTRTKILNILASQEISWPKTFNAVQSVVPKEITLTSYGISRAPDGITIHMAGKAPTNLSFASFIDAIRQNTQLTKVVVEGFTYNPTDGTVVFAISAGLTPKAALFQTSP